MAPNAEVTFHNKNVSQQRNDQSVIKKLIKRANSKRNFYGGKHPNYLVCALLQSTINQLQYDMLKVNEPERVSCHYKKEISRLKDNTNKEMDVISLIDGELDNFFAIVKKSK